MSKIVKTWPTLYAAASTGKVKVWKIWVEEDTARILIVTEHGFEDGKKTEARKEITEGKNIGKSNETSLEQQAILASQSKWQKKKDSKYCETMQESNSSDILLPMLAHNYTKRSHNIVYPCYVQPKLDGIRCIVTLDYSPVKYTSRKFKPFTTLEHLDHDIVSTFVDGKTDKPVVNSLDGELYNHQEMTFQEITRAVKKKRETTSSIKYWIYDTIDTTLPFEERIALLNNQFVDGESIVGGTELGNLVLTQTVLVQDEEEMKKWHCIFTEQGFEGTIIRNIEGLYICDHRSVDLQKYKDFDDDEFIIVGGKEATGLDAGTVVFRCITKDKVKFNVRPKGKREVRRRWLTNIDSIIGKELTVRYQGFSEEGKPRFAVGVDLRDYEN